MAETQFLVYYVLLKTKIHIFRGQGPYRKWVVVSRTGQQNVSVSPICGTLSPYRIYGVWGGSKVRRVQVQWHPYLMYNLQINGSVMVWKTQEVEIVFFVLYNLIWTFDVHNNDQWWFALLLPPPSPSHRNAARWIYVFLFYFYLFWLFMLLFWGQE